MIEFQGVGKRLGGRMVVEDVSFRALPGQVTALVGEPGSGKTVLVRCLCGLATPTTGLATIRGSRVSELAMPGRTLGASLSIGSLHPGRSGRETLVLAAMANRMPAARADEVLRQVGLDGLDVRVRDYSNDMRQRLVIGIAMAGQPSALVLDDPLRWLDHQSRAWFAELLEDLTRRGGAVLLTATPDQDVVGLADQVVVLRQGRVEQIRQMAREMD